MVEKVWSLSKAQADYGPAPRPEMRCDACRYMLPKTAVGTCKLVRGLIKAENSCKEFAPAR
ncbi:MAG: hypothetical protein WD602_01940 [Actinomycetota bacterium]